MELACKDALVGEVPGSSAYFWLDPLRDQRWERFAEEAPEASVFHSTAWLEALQLTYDYRPVVFAIAGSDGEVIGGLPFCLVESRLTGRRLVSLPFSDHCRPLLASNLSRADLLETLPVEWEGKPLRYVELRWPKDNDDNLNRGFREAASFCLHYLDLGPDRDVLFNGLHKSCFQAKIRRAQREGLTCREGRNGELLHQFYRLMTRTRRRHRLPPQPLAWFQNLVRTMGERLTIRLATKQGRPVAAMLTLSHGRTVFYKYGCSETRFNKLGGMPFLFWKAIQQAKDAGMTALDLGRSDWDQEGLIRFKDRLGTQRFTITHYRNPLCPEGGVRRMAQKLIRLAFASMPESLLVQTGKLIYRHLG